MFTALILAVWVAVATASFWIMCNDTKDNKFTKYDDLIYIALVSILWPITYLFLLTSTFPRGSRLLMDKAKEKVELLKRWFKK